MPDTTATPKKDDLAPEVQARIDAGYYCPGCGRAYTYQRGCTGSAELPHDSIDVVSSKELTGKPEDHTEAPVFG